jgi:hypothetical protein
LLRLFANVWYEAEAAYENIDVVLRFTSVSGETSNLTGLLRHASAYDRALSEPTDITEIHAPRLHARHLPGSTGTPDYTQWVVVDYQLGYDPCSCMSQGELVLNFSAFSTMSVDIIGRSISIDVPITELNYREKDFLNMSAINMGSYEPGTEIYQSMDALAASYRARQEQYLNDLNTYNLIAPLRMGLEMVGIEAVGKFIASGLTDIELTEDLYTWINLDPIEPYSFTPILGAQPPTPLIDFGTPMEQVLDTTIVKAFSDKAKKQIGNVFGSFSAEIFKTAIPGKPTPPSVPIATIEESVYKGTIVNQSTRASSPLKIPGSIAQAWPAATSLSPHGLPAYNEVLGTVALLNTPTPLFYFESTTFEPVVMESLETAFNCSDRIEFSAQTGLKLRFDEAPQFAFNPALDWNMDETKTYVLLELELEQFLPEQISGLISRSYNIESNLIEGAHRPTVSTRVYEFATKWIPLEELHQMVFSLEFDESITAEFHGVPLQGLCDYVNVEPNFAAEQLKFDVKSLNMKVMHDMNFMQEGYQTNTNLNHLKVTTFQLFAENGGINFLNDDGPWSNGHSGYFDAYIPGLITLGNETITISHPLVHEVTGNEIFINAQEVQITGPIQVEPGYSLVVQALEQIQSIPGASFNPNVHLRIKKDFYNTPVFEYADNATVYNFCNNSNAYQANTASKALRERIQAQQEQAELEETTPEVEANNKVSLYPNPANGAIQLRSSDLGISQVDVYDIAGRLMLQRIYGADAGKQVQMDIENLQTGVYIVQIHCGAQVHKEKLVVGL